MCSSEFVLDRVSVTRASRTTARDLVATNPFQALELSVTSASCLFTFFTFPPAHPFDHPPWFPSCFLLELHRHVAVVRVLH